MLVQNLENRFPVASIFKGVLILDVTKPIHIKTDKDVDILIENIISKNCFADKFVFDDDSLSDRLFSALNIEREEFNEYYYNYNRETELHISESQEGYFWISTVGLVPQGRLTTNSTVNAFTSQAWVMKTLLTEVERICSLEQVLDVDSYYSEELKSVSIAISSNMAFYSELFCKAYLSISKKAFEHIHRLSRLLDSVENTMYELGHNNTLFHGLVLPFFQTIAGQISGISPNYREEFMKYDNNAGELLLLSIERIREWYEEITISDEFISEYYYNGKECFYLESGLFQRLLDRARTDEEKDRIRKEKGFLIMDKKKRTSE